MLVEEDVLIKFLANDLKIDTSNIERSTLLVSSGVLDSFALLSVLTFIETQLRTTIRPEDITLENLDSIDRIMAFLRRGPV